MSPYNTVIMAVSPRLRPKLLPEVKVLNPVKSLVLLERVESQRFTNGGYIVPNGPGTQEV